MPSSFFKILLDPSSCNLSLPSDFVSKHLNNKIQDTPIIIQSANGGYSWKLKIKRISDGGYCFSDGWDNVVKDSQLGFGDFLFFSLVDDLAFKLSIYSPNGCEKILPQKIGGDSGGDEDDENYEKNEDPWFMTIIATTHTNLLRFPRGFAELAGIDDEGTMTVKNLDGKEWVIGMKLDKSFRSSRRSEEKLLLAKVTKNKRPMMFTDDPMKKNGTFFYLASLPHSDQTMLS
ncbi:B3 domain-containing protein REM9-like [Bidens hawaiensis]|uniref:B3 domain-containing protein REM9-like n=1 Tax=Bidens hawaiensis TaxID=980011 RepID=UPI00404A3CA8